MKVLSKQKVYTSSVHFKALFLCQVPYFCFGIFLYDHHQDDCVQKKSGFNKSVFTEQELFFFFPSQWIPRAHFKWWDSKSKHHFSKQWRAIQHGILCTIWGASDTPCHFWKGGTSLCTAAFRCCMLRVGLSRVILAFICFSIFNIIKLIF